MLIKRSILFVISVTIFHIGLLVSKHHNYRFSNCPFLVYIPLTSNFIADTKCRYNLLKILELIEEAEDGLTVEYISSSLNLSRKSVRMYLNKLGSNGLIERVGDKYKITEKGRNLIRSLKLSGF
ncbi:winged helix-turn-helix domain-containing protein [Sulfolobus sp. E11-6]|uniref:winged helix-turn-helix domain-containing protein n=1 Tax=Sulfolobus sp. E11-6 TaxID=2663020 RepID=UPI001296E744|nr:winged helix-turn-helix transcriptional regulator [Sulfolobus sp. E11-6]